LDKTPLLTDVRRTENLYNIILKGNRAATHKGAEDLTAFALTQALITRLLGLDERQEADTSLAETIRVFIADDHAVVREGLRA